MKGTTTERRPSRRCGWVLLWLLASVGLALPAGARAAEAPSPSPPRFVEVTRAAGIAFHLTCGEREKRYILSAMCGGVAFLDYDNDGWEDLLFINGATLDQLHAGSGELSRLYHNNRDGTFTDVTARAGLTHRGLGMGVAVGDYDNDGWEDLYITYWGGGVLYRNRGDGTFEDVTATAGVGNPDRWGASAAFGDYDNDGNLDLYVTNYVHLNLDHLPEPYRNHTLICEYRGVPMSCGPRGLEGERDRLYHNNGDGSFTDVTEKLGIDPHAYYGLGVIWTDYDNDGWQDIYVANDSTPSLLYHNNHDGTFREEGVPAGVAVSAGGRLQAGMGVDAGDFDNDGHSDFIKTNLSDDTNNLYRNGGDGFFDDVGDRAQFSPPSRRLLGFGTKFLDFDNDGWLDVFVADGHLTPAVDTQDFGITYAQRNLLFHNRGDGRFDEEGRAAGLTLEKVSRGAASADFDNDGDLDLVVTNLDDSPTLLRNDSPQGHWLRLKLVGTRSNRDALGARVEVLAGGRRQVKESRANSSYLSANDSRLHFGLGAASHVQEIVIHWPSGRVDRLENQPADRQLTVVEGEGVTSSEAAPARRTGKKAKESSRER